MSTCLNYKIFPFLFFISILIASPTDKKNIPDETKRKISKSVEYKVVSGEREKVQIRTKVSALSEKNPGSDKIIPKEIVPTESRVIIGGGAKVIIGTQLSAKLWYDNIILKSDAKLIKDEEGERQLSKEANANKILNDEASLPTELSISKAYPNPFNPVVNISYGLPEQADVKILIHDLTGRKIANYTINQQSAGWHEFSWSALDQIGQTIGSGIYLLTIQASDMVKKQKITFLK